ncbi:MAG: hydroxyacid dehydrogenase [Geminicoccaceae bacterium]|nr:MAG: hydroxyacid dehydrogenase [Geminicoccaceae bacterium]
MKIVVFELEPWEREAFRPLEQAHEVVFVEAPLDETRVADHADADIVSVFIHSKLTADVIRALERVRLVATRSTGVDHIDLAACKECGITVTNVPTYGDHTVAEHVFALLLALSRTLVDAVDRTRRGDFSLTGIDGFDLAGRTMGLIGTGGIGRHTAKIARGFDMEVIAFDVAPDPEAAAEFGFTYVELDELLARADVVSLHVPGTPQTENLLGQREFERMKDGAVLINTARGSVVDTEAMLHALASGKLRGVGLDVLAEEPTVREEAELLRSYFAKAANLETLLADHILLRLRNVVVTPHSAFKTKEAVERILATTRANIEGFLEGAPENVVA